MTSLHSDRLAPSTEITKGKPGPKAEQPGPGPRNFICGLAASHQLEILLFTCTKLTGYECSRGVEVTTRCREENRKHKKSKDVVHVLTTAVVILSRVECVE